MIQSNDKIALQLILKIGKIPNQYLDTKSFRISLKTIF